MSKHVLYLVTNIINGKQYVGLTCRSLEQRWYQHLYEKGKRSFSLLHKAVRKYGKENFLIEHIASAVTREDAYEIEKILIEQYKTFRPAGYNFTFGGGSAFGFEHTEDARRRIGEGHRGLKYKLSDEERKRRSDRMKNWRLTPGASARRKAAYAKQWTLEARAKASASAKGRIFSPEMRKKLQLRSAKARPVVCNHDQRQFSSVRAAADYYGLKANSIVCVALGRKKTIHGLSFSYLNSDQRRVA